MTPPDNAHPTYALGYDPNLLKNFRSRSARVHAAHLVPHLKPGMRVLDAGSGQGSITIDLAKLVGPTGDVTGFDFEVSQIADATAAAKAAGVTNIRFEQQDVTKLPYQDATFDAVHMCALLIHVPQLKDALRELKRVMKPGAVLSTRDPFFSGTFWLPEDPLCLESHHLRGWAIDAAGGDGDFGLHSAQALHDAGFERISVIGDLEGGLSREAIATALEISASAIGEDDFAQRVIKAGRTTADRIKQMQAALRNAINQPYCWFSVPHTNVIAWKP